MRFSGLFSIPVVIIVLNFSYLWQFDKENRDSWQQPDRIMDTLGIKAGMIIGEAGAGEGYFTFKLANRVGEQGKIFANDIDEKKLKKIEERCQEENIHNITIILGKTEDPLFPKAELDMAIMVYVFHHLEKPVAFLKNIKASLKPSAPLVIIERDPDKFNDRSGHFLPKKEVIQAIKEANYDLSNMETFLPRDNIFICHPRK
jgi:ubiquinone/menaquinone biosynthesis C-methylase UbiE